MNDPKSIIQNTLRMAQKFSDRRGVYRHWKGGEYILYSISIDENTLIPMVHYYNYIHDSRWTRTLANWTEAVNGKPRFEKVREASLIELIMASGLSDFIPEDSNLEFFPRKS